MKAIYIPVGASGHVLASLPMIAALVRRGVQITYFAPESFREQVELTGAAFCPMPAVAAKAGSISAGRDFLAGIPLVFLGECEGIVGKILPLIEQLSPDVVIADELALAGRIAAHRLRVPLIMMFTSYAPCRAFSISRTWPVYPDTHPAREAARHLAEHLSGQYDVPVWDVYSIFEDTGDYNISTLSKDLQPAGYTFGSNFCFAGAQIAPRAQDAAWERPNKDRRLLYTSLGSLFNNWPEFYEMLFPIVREMDIDVICALGKALRPEDLGDIPSNVTLMPFAPQLDILAQADCFITHAGTGSAMEALHFGVPCITLPQMDEQRLTAERLHVLGVAPAPLDRMSLTEETLRKAILEVLGNAAYSAKAKLLSSGNGMSGAEKAAQAVVDYMKKR